MSPYNKLNVQIEVKVLFKINYIRNINFLKVSTKKRKNTQILKFHALKLKILPDILFFSLILLQSFSLIVIPTNHFCNKQKWNYSVLVWVKKISINLSGMQHIHRTCTSERYGKITDFKNSTVKYPVVSRLKEILYSPNEILYYLH